MLRFVLTVVGGIMLVVAFLTAHGYFSFNQSRQKRRAPVKAASAIVWQIEQASLEWPDLAISLYENQIASGFQKLSEEDFRNVTALYQQSLRRKHLRNELYYASICLLHDNPAEALKTLGDLRAFADKNQIALPDDFNKLKQEAEKEKFNNGV